MKQEILILSLGSMVSLPCISSWIILMQRFDGSLNFSNNWTECKNGFGDIRGTEFWIGNENMHRITNVIGMSYKLRVEVRYSL